MEGSRRPSTKVASSTLVPSPFFLSLFFFFGLAGGTSLLEGRLGSLTYWATLVQIDKFILFFWTVAFNIS